MAAADDVCTTRFTPSAAAARMTFAEPFTFVSSMWQGCARTWRSLRRRGTRWCTLRLPSEVRPRRARRRGPAVAELGHVSCRGIAFGRRSNAATVGDEAFDDAASDESASAGDEDRIRRNHYRSSVSAARNRTRYSIAETTVMAAAAVITYSSKNSGPARGAERWPGKWRGTAFVFALPQIDGEPSPRQPRPRRAVP